MSTAIDDPPPSSSDPRRSSKSKSDLNPRLRSNRRERSTATQWLPNPTTRSPISATTSSSSFNAGDYIPGRMALLDSSSRPHLHRRHKSTGINYGCKSIPMKKLICKSIPKKKFINHTGIQRFCQATGYGGTVQRREMTEHVPPVQC
ncbi:unnamed protein product [Camellia sinensis]